MDYENPFGAITPASFAGNPGGPGFVNQWETGVATEKAEMAKPFIDMMKQRDEMELAKKRMEFGEFGSPEAVAARRNEMLFRGEKANADRQRIAPELARDIAKAETELRTMGPEADSKIAQAQEIAQNIKDKPIQKFFAAAADYGNVLNASKADPLTKAADYKQWLEDFKQQNPTVTIPPNMENWSANTGRYLAQARLVSLHSVAHEQKMEEEKVKTDSQERIAKGNNAATIGAAQVTATQSGANTQLAYGSKEDAVMARREQQRDKLYATLLSADIEYMTAPPERKAAIRNEYQGIADERYPTTRQTEPRASGDPLRDAVVKSGYEFEPDKFEYRIGPNGIAQRKPKGK